MTAGELSRDGVLVSDSADVAESARLGIGTRVWHHAQVCDGAVLGRFCVVGRGAYVGPDVPIGDHAKLQNHALVYSPAELGDGVFVGPAAVLTNDLHPRAVAPDGRPQSVAAWMPVPVRVREGASLGARCVCVAPVTIGRWAMVGAGATVVRDVPAFALVVGAPARQIGWVGRSGFRLEPDGPGRWRCPTTDERYRERGGELDDDHT